MNESPFEREEEAMTIRFTAPTAQEFEEASKSGLIPVPVELQIKFGAPAFCTPKEFILSKFPTAGVRHAPRGLLGIQVFVQEWREYAPKTNPGRPMMLPIAIGLGIGPTEEAAWEDAANRLKA